MTFNQADLQNIARQLLAEDPAPAAQVRLYREVLGLDEKDSALINAKEALAASPSVRQLADEQWPDGSWGRLHSRDSTAQQKILTTEMGVARALGLGLRSDHPILQKAADRLRAILRGEKTPRDRAERNKRWAVGVQLFAAATLAQIYPADPEVDGPWDLWIEVVRRAFASGVYDPDAEGRAHLVLTGASIRNSYLTLNNRYSLTLLSARPKALPAILENQLVDWIWHLPQGINYLPGALHQPPEPNKAGPLEWWFAAHELMSRFPSWKIVSERMRGWLWGQMEAERRWDFDKRVSTSVALPFTANWRRPGARSQDWTARVVLLLNTR